MIAKFIETGLAHMIFCPNSSPALSHWWLRDFDSCVFRIPNEFLFHGLVQPILWTYCDRQFHGSTTSCMKIYLLLVLNLAPVSLVYCWPLCLYWKRQQLVNAYSHFPHHSSCYASQSYSCPHFLLSRLSCPADSFLLLSSECHTPFCFGFLFGAELTF